MCDLLHMLVISNCT